MPKINLKNGTSFWCSEVQGQEIMQKQTDSDSGAVVEFGNHQPIRRFKVSDVVGIEWERKKYNLDVPEDRKIISDFLRMIADLSEKKLFPDVSIARYGDDYRELHVRHPEHPVRDGWVFNEILGLVPWNLVQWAMDKNIIALRDDLYPCWTVKNLGEYNDLKMKISAWRQLRSRQERASEYENSRMGQFGLKFDENG